MVCQKFKYFKFKNICPANSLTFVVRIVGVNILFIYQFTEESWIKVCEW